MERSCTGDQPASDRGRGLDEIAQAVKLLQDAGIICCIVGSKALFYYGAARVSNGWCVCVPNDRLHEAAALFNGLGDLYEPAPKILPQNKSLWHTYPRFKPVGIRLPIYIMPASEFFLQDLEESMLERSRNQLPYPKLEIFAQGLLSTQRWPDLVHLVDGMDLTEEWGYENLYLGESDEKERKYVADKNNKIMSSYGDFPNSHPEAAKLSPSTKERRQKWQSIVGGKKQRIGPYLPQERYQTQFRKNGSIEPRLREARAILC